MCCMTCTAPDATKNATLCTVNDPQCQSKEAKLTKIWLKKIIQIQIKILTSWNKQVSKMMSKR